MKNKTSRKPSDESVVYRRFVGEPIKRSRKGESRFEKSQEWRLAQADLDKRNFVPNEHIMFALTDERKRELGIQNRRTIADPTPAPLEFPLPCGRGLGGGVVREFP